MHVEMFPLNVFECFPSWKARTAETGADPSEHAGNLTFDPTRTRKPLRTDHAAVMQR